MFNISVLFVNSNTLYNTFVISSIPIKPPKNCMFPLFVTNILFWTNLLFFKTVVMTDREFFVEHKNPTNQKMFLTNVGSKTTKPTQEELEFGQIAPWNLSNPIFWCFNTPMLLNLCDTFQTLLYVKDQCALLLLYLLENLYVLLTRYQACVTSTLGEVVVQSG